MESNEIEAKLQEAFDVLHGLQADERDAGVAAATAKVAYDVAYAKALLVARDRKLAIEAAKAEATVYSEAEYRTSLLAEAQLRTARSTLNVLSTQVDILRTLAASHRSVFGS